ncbi:MAG: TonB-dependent receptor [Cyclobacteriaceae bacterium]
MTKFTLRLFILIGLTLQVSLAGNSSAQVKSVRDVRITLSERNTSLLEVFQEIEKSTDYTFNFSKDKINLSKSVSIGQENASVERILLDLSKEHGLAFKQVNNNISVFRNKGNATQDNIELEILVDVEISGRVTDENGEGLPGASVVVKGTTNGTTTNLEGNYKMNAPDNALIIVSYVGYITQEIEVGGRSTIDVPMRLDAAQLEEIVVVGYGTQKKSDLTGAVSSVSEKDLQSRPVPSFQDALQGRSSGVNIRQRGGDLAGKFDISIRGVGSVTGSNAPLIVVDGIPLFSADFSTINPKDIASINILKDASATAIYGARASNGVVIISTRRGENGQAKFTFSTDLGFEEITKRYEVLSTEQQRQLFVEGFKNSNRSTAVYDDPSHPAWQIDTDWQDLGTRTAFRQAYNFGVTGGTDKSKYAISASMLNREGTIINSDLRSWSIRANIDSKINERTTIVASLTGSHQKSNEVNNDSFFGSGYRSLVFQHSYTEAYDENGELTAVNSTAAPYFGGNSNPLVDIILPTRENNVTRVLGSVRADVDIIEGLKLSGNIGGDVVNSDGYVFLPVYQIGRFQRLEGSVTESAGQQVNWVADATLQYEKEFGEHSTKLLVGASAQQFTIRNFSANGTGTINNALNQLTNQTNFSASGSDVSAGLLSTFLRFNYDFSDKYLMTATVRRDGSSRFGPGNRYGIFPSASFAWRISEEDFLSGSNILNDLKLRASYGLTGNQNIGNFAFITRAGAANYVFGNSAVIGNAPVNIGNEDLKWESSKQLDIGLNASFFEGRLNMEMDYYDKRSEDLLIAPPIPLTSGVSGRPIVNIGSVKNTGVEFAVNSRNITGDISWTTDFNITYNKNEVLDIGLNSQGEPLELAGNAIPLGNERVNLTQAGQPVGAFNTYIFDGIWQLGQETEANAWSNAVPGDARYVDVNENGTFDQGDRQFTGTSPHPKFFGGINNTVSYKNFSVSVFMNFATGYQLYNSARNLFSRSVPFVQNFAEVADFWTPENPSNSVPRPSQGGNTTFLATRPSTRFLEDADFLRIKNVSVSYNLPGHLAEKMKMQSARVTLTGTNLATFTGYTGLDPEASSVGNLLSVGIDHTPYPLTKLYSMSLEFTF